MKLHVNLFFSRQQSTGEFAYLYSTSISRHTGECMANKLQMDVFSVRVHICNMKLMFDKSSECRFSFFSSFGFLILAPFLCMDELPHTFIMQSSRHWKCKPLKLLDALKKLYGRRRCCLHRRRHRKKKRFPNSEMLIERRYTRSFTYHIEVACFCCCYSLFGKNWTCLREFYNFTRT